LKSALVSALVRSLGARAGRYGKIAGWDLFNWQHDW